LNDSAFPSFSDYVCLCSVFFTPPSKALQGAAYKLKPIEYHLKRRHTTVCEQLIYKTFCLDSDIAKRATSPETVKLNSNVSVVRTLRPNHN